VIGTATTEIREVSFVRPVIAIVASAGGLSAFSKILGDLPSDFNAAIVVLQHLDPTHLSHLAEILGRRTRLRVKEAADQERLQSGVVFTAPPRAHLLVSPEGRLSLSNSAAVNFVRPAADRLLESLATSFGPRAIAVVLTGTGRDGASGAQAVKRAGGTVIVQDEATSEFFGMPGAAIHAGLVDQILPLEEIGPALETLIGGMP
jgi:two-component system, chemotaxis family, protein-glutamate methylesterase/glutaminase